MSPDDEEQTTEAQESVEEPTAEQPVAAKAKPAARAPRKPAAAATKRAPRASSRAKAPETATAEPGGEQPEAAAEDAAGDEAPAKRAAPSKRGKQAVGPRPLPRLMARYRNEIRGQLVREFGFKSPMQAPEAKKVVINIGLGEALTNNRAMEVMPLHVGVISGQRPVITKARISVAGFRVREGQQIGVMVTLRGRRMYEFLDRMISLALPRIRDFRGVPRTSFDGKGNYSLGLREQIVFPEIDYATVDRVRGLQVTITTSARNDPEGFRLLELMGMPFAKEAKAS